MKYIGSIGMSLLEQCVIRLIDCSVPIVCATISTALRLWAKRAGRNGITLDDWLIVFATVGRTITVTLNATDVNQVCLIGECASGLGYGPPHGMGRHVIAVETHDLVMVRKVWHLGV